jgi:hypothetical protein
MRIIFNYTGGPGVVNSRPRPAHPPFPATHTPARADTGHIVAAGELPAPHTGNPGLTKKSAPRALQDFTN